MATPTTLPNTFTTGQILTAAQMNNLRGAFRVLQVVSTTKSDAFTTTSTTMTDITGLSATITPSATSSLILVQAVLWGSPDHGVSDAYFQLVRGSTAIFIGDAAGSRRRQIQVTSAGSAATGDHSVLILDNPATTSATTYKLQITTSGSGTAYVNRSKTDTDSASFSRQASSITVMEISA